MEINNVYAIYFSPTGGTKKCVMKISEILKKDYTEIDLTNYDIRNTNNNFKKDDIVVIGVPVYAGRVPTLYDGIFTHIQGNDTPAVFVVSYGNRDYEDALIEMQYELEKKGFIGVGAGAFIAEHTYSDKLGGNRPDKDDENILTDFSKKVKEKIINDNFGHNCINIKGNKIFKEKKFFPYHPSADESCKKCGICEKLCPVKAISINDFLSVDKDKCINCFRCVKNCPSNSIKISDDSFYAIKKMLEDNFSKIRKEPELFY